MGKRLIYQGGHDGIIIGLQRRVDCAVVLKAVG